VHAKYINSFSTLHQKYFVTHIYVVGMADLYISDEPSSLELLCLQYIRKTLDKIDSLQDDYSVFINEVSRLHGPMIVSILDFLGRSGSMSNFKLRKLLGTAESFSNCMKSLHLYDIRDNVSAVGLLNFSCFAFEEIVLKFDKKSSSQPSINELLQAFKGSKNSLQILKLICYPMTLPDQEHIFKFAARFTNLKSFCIHTYSENCEIDLSHWRVLLCSCQSLEELEIFMPKNKGKVELDASSISENRRSIRSLRFPAMLTYSKISFGLTGLLNIDGLTHLDISVDDDPEVTNAFIGRTERSNYIIDFMDHLGEEQNLPGLVSLDLSGLREVESGHISNLLKTHAKIKFLGLCLLEVEYTNSSSVAGSVNNVKITGTNLENQIILSLEVYKDRALYTREALKSLFTVCGHWTERRPDVIELVLQVLRSHPDDHLLQLAATACLYNLTKNDIKLKPVPPKQLVEAAELSLQVLKRFLASDKRQIMKNCLLIFCNDRLLHYPKFKRFEVSRVCLDCMLAVPESQDRHITRMAVAIVSVLACKITSKETSQLTEGREMNLLLSIAKERLPHRRIDGTLKFDLSALWNLTDESPKACHLFVDLGGLDLYVNLLCVFSEDHSIQTKVLGLLNNIAEVKDLHEKMIVDSLMQHVGELILSEEKSVSYFAGGIIANIVYGWKPQFKLQVSSKQELLDKLDKAINSWGTLESEIVTYRSFKPFLGLLESFELGPVQHFSLWAIHHVCTLNSERYKDLMTEECIMRLAKLRRAAFSISLQQQKQRAMVDDIFKACNVEVGQKLDMDVD